MQGYDRRNLTPEQVAVEKVLHFLDHHAVQYFGRWELCSHTRIPKGLMRGVLDYLCAVGAVERREIDIPGECRKEGGKPSYAGYRRVR